jgi:hypothetical protein
MSTEKPKDQGVPDDVAALKGAFSPGKGRAALDGFFLRHAGFFGGLWQWRLWFLVAGAATFVLPVLYNDDTISLTYSGSTSLYGFNLLVPVTSNTYTDAANGVTYASFTGFSIDPLALVLYGLVALHLYLFFVKTPVSPRLTAWHGFIQTAIIILMPFLEIPVLNVVLHGFSSYWGIQPPSFGFWIVLLSGLALWTGAYSQILKAHPPHAPPSLSK